MQVVVVWDHGESVISLFPAEKTQEIKGHPEMLISFVVELFFLHHSTKGVDGKVDKKEE
jgi:hypothetical protein